MTKFQDGQIVSLNGISYRIQERLGRGAVSDAYLAQVVKLQDSAVVVKTIRDDAAGDPSKKKEALEHEAEVLTKLNRAEITDWSQQVDALARLQRARETVTQRRIVALLDRGDAASGQPLLVQELAPPTLERFDVATVGDEYRATLVAQAVAEAIALAHRHNLALKDFEPRAKWDRVRVQWLHDDQHLFTLKIIDWNITGGTEAMSQDLFYFGGHLYYLLLGRYVPLDNEGQPPVNLGLGVLDWDQLTEGSRHILRKLLHRDPRRRYQSADQLLADVSWWADTLAQAEASNTFRRLDDRLWQARPSGRYDRVLAVADLALHLNPPADARQSFESSRQQAREELDKEKWQPIAHAQVSLGTRAYEKAADEFAQQLRILPEESEAARLARIYQRLARIGELLRKHHQGSDERSTPEWAALEHAVKALTQRKWGEAQTALSEALHLRPEAQTWMPVNDLLDLTRAGVLHQTEVNDLLAKAQPSQADARRPALEWAEVEREQIEWHEKAVEKLREVQDLAPLEPEFQERLNVEQARLKQRNEFFARYREADKYIAQGRDAFSRARSTDRGGLSDAAQAYHTAYGAFQNALQELRVILDVDPAQPRARFLKQDVQQLSSEAETGRSLFDALREAKELLEIGRYDQALPQARQAAELDPSRRLVQETLAEAEAGARILEQVRVYLQSAETYIQTDKLAEARKQLVAFSGWNGQLLSALSSEQSLPSIVGAKPFRLLQELNTKANELQLRIQEVQRANDEAQAAWRRGDYKTVTIVYDELQARYSLSAQQRKLLEEAQQFIDHEKEAKSLVNQPQGFDDLSRAFRLLEGDVSSEADQIRHVLAIKWIGSSEELTDLDTLGRRVREGMRLFEKLPEAMKRLEVMRDLIERSRNLSDNLRTMEGQLWPYWFGGAEWSAQLHRLVEDIDVISREQSWAVLREKAAEWRAQLEQYLTAYLQNRLKKIHQKAQSKHFSEALEEAEIVWYDVPERLRRDLPPDVCDGFQKFIEVLRTRIEAQEKYTNIMRKLESSDFSFQEAAEEAETVLADVLRHTSPQQLSYLNIEDLKAIRSDLKLAADVEGALQSNPVADLQPAEGKINYAQLIHISRRLAQAPLKTLQMTPELQSRSSALKEGMTSKKDTTAQQLRDALKTAAEDQLEHPESDPRPVIDLYAQARWWQSASQSWVFREVRRAQKLPNQMLEKVAELLANAQDVGEVKASLEILECLGQLNDGLAFLPVEQLPPLPEGARYDDSVVSWQPLSSSSLDALHKEIESLIKLNARVQALVLDAWTLGALEEEVGVSSPDEDLSQANVSDALMEEDGSVSEGETSEMNQPVQLLQYDPDQVSAVQGIARDLQKSYRQICAVWETLEIKETALADSNLGQLNREANVHLGIAGKLSESHQHLLDVRVMEGLNELYESLEDPDNPHRIEILDDFSIWLLARPRQALKGNFEALRGSLVAKLGDQVAKILEAPIDDAVEQMQEQILYVPKARWVGEQAYKAIWLGIDQRAERAIDNKRRDEAQRSWEIVMKATEPWKPQSDEEVLSEREGKKSRRRRDTSKKTKSSSPSLSSSSPPPPVSRPDPSSTSGKRSWSQSDRPSKPPSRSRK